jgi:hypothetical protein
MGFNFNNYEEEYELFNSQTEEMINMFGLEIKYVKSTNQNLDEIFGEFSHKKFTQDGIEKFFVYPEAFDDFQSIGNTFSKFGFSNTETFNCFVSANGIDSLGYTNPKGECVGDIIVLPNNKKFEITLVDDSPVGTNNMFPYSNKKNVYLLQTKFWSYNGDEKEVSKETTDSNGIVTKVDNLEEFNFATLDELFNTEETKEANKTPKRKIVQKKESSTVVTKKPSPFGDFD